jgi:TPR repeat protein
MKPHGNNSVNKSIRILSELAENGHPRAQFDLAWCYSRGFGVNVNVTYANRLYDSALSGGVFEAALWKQLFSLNAKTKKNTAEFINKLKAFADKDSKFAQYVVGANLLFYGKQQINVKEGLTYLKKSAQNGFPAAAFALDSFYRVYSNPRNLAEADIWRERGRELTKAYVSAIPDNYDYFQFLEYANVLKGELQTQFNGLIEAEKGPKEELSFIRQGAEYMYTGNQQ